LKLSGRDQKAVVDALEGAFNPDEFEQLVRFSLERNVDSITGPAAFPVTVSRVVRFGETRDAIGQLLLDARQWNPRNAELADVTERLSLVPDVARRLEKTIIGQFPLFDPADFREQMVNAENRVCEVEVGEATAGSGFLVGPDLVMTNHHVVSTEIGSVRPRIVVRFDYTSQRSAAREVKLAADWLLTSSPPSPLDDIPVDGREPTMDQLDFAIIRLDTLVGAEPVSELADEPRGWVTLRSDPAVPPVNTSVLVMQHPGGGPRRCAIGDFLGENTSRTRMRYQAITQGGSSGSPCFNLGWRLVGLHHGSQPGADLADYNEGIPAAALVESLTRTGHLSALP
jgi:hypothetical protein